MPVTTKEALELVIDLAANNVLEDEQVLGDPELKREQRQQERALDLVRSLYNALR